MGATLREVDRRARMSLADLLEELIPDSDTRETFYWRSGIRPPVAAQEEDDD
jgi:type VI secretion system protein ImpA